MLLFFLVYSSYISIDQAIRQLYKLSMQNEVKDVALLLQGVILRSLKNKNELAWPPAASDFKVTNDIYSKHSL